MKSNLKILYLNENPLPSRYTTHTIQAKELRLRAALPFVSRIDIITPISYPKIANKNPSVPKVHLHHLIPFPYYWRSIPLFFQGFVFCLRTKPDLIEAESPIISGVSAILLKTIFHRPAVIEYRASYDELLKLKVTWLPIKIKQVIFNYLCRAILSRASSIIVNSFYYQKQLRLRWQVKSYPLNPGLQNVPSTIAPFFYNPKPFIVGFLGRLVPEKGIQVLILAFKILQTKSLTVPVKLIIAGDGPQKKSLINLVHKLKLTPLVEFTGWQDNYTALKKFHLLVNPNLVHHPLEMVNIEAASMGIPVISFGTAGCPETVIHNLTGILVETQKAEPLAQAILNLIQDSNLRLKFRKNALKFSKQYSFESQVDRLSLTYQKLRLI